MGKTRRLAEELFNQAADLPVEEREAFLNSKSGLDPQVRAEVERLLARLGKPSVPSLEALENLDETTDKDLEGSDIGPYKLLQLIGEGGFGVVYLAEQKEPIQRRVALKIIKLGMDTRQIIARFEAERQALALMDHAHIARVFDAGATEQGRPFFVMELVKGVPLTEYADSHGLTTKERLGLFMQVCRAVQHAHHKGIIHRDLKPTNILVTLHDGVAVPKVIDFGIARATDQALTDKTVFTRFGQFIGTPQYMSPEQAVISGLDVDTRTDIYSLGVLLYELLTGSTPFDAKTLHGADFGEMQRLIREEPPPQPSQRLSTQGADPAEVAQLRRTEPRALKRMLRGELDWIVMKALEKDRNRRYDSAGALAEDLQRFLESEPVLAGPPSRVYRFRKWVARNKAISGFMLALAVLILGFGIWMGLLYDQANQLRLQAVQEQEQAETHLERAQEAERLARSEALSARQISTYLVDLFKVGDVKRGQEERLTIREVIDRGAAGIQDLADLPEAQATLMHTLGQVYTSLGHYHEAIPLLEEAHAIRLELAGEENGERLYYLACLGRALTLSSRLTEAEPFLREAMELSQQVYGVEGKLCIKAKLYLANALLDLGQRAEAEALAREALAVNRRTHGKTHPDTLYALETLARILHGQARLDAAGEIFAEVYEISRALHGEDHLSTAGSMGSLGAIYLEQGKTEAAEGLLQKALEIRKRELGDDHTLTLEAMVNLAEVALRLGRVDEARGLYEQSLAGSRATLGENHRNTINCRVGIGRVLLEKGQYKEGVALLHEGLADFQQTMGNDYPQALRLMRLIAIVHLRNNAPDQAEAMIRDILEILENQHPPHYLEIAEAKEVLGGFLMNQNRPKEAERYLREAQELFKTHPTPPEPQK